MLSFGQVLPFVEYMGRILSKIKFKLKPLERKKRGHVGIRASRSLNLIRLGGNVSQRCFVVLEESSESFIHILSKCTA